MMSTPSVEGLGVARRTRHIGLLVLGLAVALSAAWAGIAWAEAAPAAGAPDVGRGNAPASATPTSQDAGALPRPTAPAASQDAGAAPRPTAPAEAAPAAKKPRKPLTEEEVKELPPLKRFDIPIEKGEELLKDVRDETFGYDESAFYYMLDKVLKTPVDFFKPDAQVTPYKALLAMPSSYRGQAVTIRGVYMTAYPFSPPPLAIWKDVHTVYECSIREPPLNEHRPIATVIVIDDPMTYLRAGDDVLVKGYFYKVRQYEFRRSDDAGGIVTGKDVAPLLIARRLEPEEAGSPLARLGPAPSLFGGAGDYTCAGLMIAAVVLLGGAFFYLLWRTKAKSHAPSERPVHKFRLRRPDRIEPPAPGGAGDTSGSPKP